ncbi:hypothetical protein A3759_14585 [Thalassolituus sp. HI0120]|nr:hypothetical protein A3759_14585 [Thalassolituus sp. HI0120]
MAKSVNNRAMSQPQNRWALLGGTFDPIHIGHLRIAAQLRDLGFSKVLLIPNRIPPHRPQPQASGGQRLQMVSLGCESLTGVEPCAIELQRDDLSYSAVTVSALKQQHPEVQFTWVIGDDAWQGFEFWHQPLELLQLANLLVVSRPELDSAQQSNASDWQQQQLSQRQSDITQLLAAEHGRICLKALPELDISASYLRQAIKQGDNIRFLVPDAVLEYLNQHQLYR